MFFQQEHTLSQQNQQATKTEDSLHIPFVIAWFPCGNASKYQAFDERDGSLADSVPKMVTLWAPRNDGSKPHAGTYSN